MTKFQIFLKITKEELQKIIDERNKQTMPNKEAKSRKMLKKKLSSWCNRYGRTKRQLAKYKKKHGKDSVPSPPTY